MMKFKDMPYERIDFAKAEEELKGLMQELREAKSGEEQFETHKKYYRLNDHVETQATICQIRHTIDTTDAFYEKEQKYYDEQMPAYSNLRVAYQKMLYESPYRETLEEKIGPVAFRNIEIAMKSVSDEVIPLMQEENMLATEYEKLLAGAQIDWGRRDAESFPADAVSDQRGSGGSEKGGGKTERIFREHRRKAGRAVRQAGEEPHRAGEKAGL